MTTTNAVNERDIFSSNAGVIFGHVFEKIETEIPFNANWRNGTGYLDRAHRGDVAPVLEPGAAVKSIDSNGRKIIIVGLVPELGNAVMFQRFSGDIAEDKQVIVMNSHQIVAFIVNTSDLAADDVRTVHNGIYSPIYNLSVTMKEAFSKA